MYLVVVENLLGCGETLSGPGFLDSLEDEVGG